MKNLFRLVCFVFLACFGSLAHAIVLAPNDGSACSNAYVVTDGFTATIPSAGTYWFTATTDLLPFTVRYTPNSSNQSVRPSVSLDLTCTPGNYSFDPQLANVIAQVRVDFPQYSLPYIDSLEPEVVNGRTLYSKVLSSKYRTQLSYYGIDYPVQAYVKVVFPEAGTFVVESSGCVAQHLSLPDTILILARDSVSSYVLPMNEWTNDSIWFTWSGDQPARMDLAYDGCEFRPGEGSASYVIPANGRFTLTNAQIATLNRWSTQLGTDGTWYAKILSTSRGTLVIEKGREEYDCEANSTLIELGVPFRPVLNNRDKAFRLRYADIKDGKLKLTWVTDNGRSTSAQLLFRKWCQGTVSTSTSSDENLLLYKGVSKGAVVEVTNSQLAGWARQLDDEFVYVHVITTTAGQVTIDCVIPGDVNGDKQVNIADVTKLVSYIVSPSDAGAGFKQEAADFNGDGSVNISDVTSMITKIVNR
ncbi:MAG: dockerin type I repeat-containing protein [Paludibacteraceae bacterium]|nr:dockerin type I repeat-containing protein [Paludibacteraceae bacterium]